MQKLKRKTDNLILILDCTKDMAKFNLLAHSICQYFLVTGLKDVPALVISTEWHNRLCVELLELLMGTIEPAGNSRCFT